jgi:hypothetical protein
VKLFHWHNKAAHEHALLMYARAFVAFASSQKAREAIPLSMLKNAIMSGSQ